MRDGWISFLYDYNLFKWLEFPSKLYYIKQDHYGLVHIFSLVAFIVVMDIDAIQETVKTIFVPPTAQLWVLTGHLWYNMS